MSAIGEAKPCVICTMPVRASDNDPHFARSHPDPVHVRCQNLWMATCVSEKREPSCPYCNSILEITPQIRNSAALTTFFQSFKTSTLIHILAATMASAAMKGNGGERVGTAIAAYSFSQTLGVGFSTVRALRCLEMSQANLRQGMFLGCALGGSLILPAISMIRSKWPIKNNLWLYGTALSTAVLINLVFNFKTISEVFHDNPN